MDKILILEDSPMMQSLYRMVLSGGAELLFAGDGVEGMDLAAGDPDVALYIVDVNLPRMDGLEFIRRLRSELGIADRPVVVVSTECEDRDKAAAYEAGADAYLCKPWRPEELESLLASLEPTDGSGAPGV
ncbi:MAG: response regulator [Gemmatimonadota bacterium]|jgi:two-component system chemotaxis response regulator CheY